MTVEMVVYQSKDQNDLTPDSAILLHKMIRFLGHRFMHKHMQNELHCLAWTYLWVRLKLLNVTSYFKMW